MRFTSMEALSTWVMNTLNERMQRNADDMLDAGCSPEDIEVMRASFDVERCYRDMMADLERFVSDPTAPSPKLQ